MKNTLQRCVRPIVPHPSVLIGLGVCVLFLASLRVDSTTQFYLSLALFSALLLIRRYEHPGFWRVLFLALSSFVVLRYFLWRTFYTLGYNDFFSFIGSVILYAAELYGVLMFFLSSFVNIRPLRRQFIPLPEDVSLWPTVDVIVPSYNEPLELVKITLAAASNIYYPKEKLNIYLLDDGATEEKLNASDEQARQIAVRRRAEFMALCDELGIHYLARRDNRHAKAGNMNAALEHIHGELILVLDADHAPATDILHKTVGSFVKDKKVFLVQTPHFFINPDPIEKNLKLFHRMPSENFMFYGAIQLGLDFWQASFFCGSAAVLRREAINEVGGFKGKTITEDSETALMLHSKGWKSHYVMRPLISGLQPETFSSFMVQRIRWAQGMVQNFIFHNPLFQPKLRIGQKISYLSNMLFWFFPFARLVFLLSPGMYLLFGLKIYNANTLEFFCYTVPYLLALVLTNHYLFRKVRWAFLSEIYEILQSLFSLRAIWAVLKDPAHPQFAVTPKMETLEQDFISPLSRPFYWTISFTVVLVVFGVWRCIAYPAEQPLIAITMFWAIFNLLLLLSVLGALYEQKQRRGNPRFPVSIYAYWVGVGEDGVEETLPVTIVDLSVGGGRIVADSLLLATDGGLYSLDVIDAHTGLIERFNMEIANHFPAGQQYIYGIRFKPANIAEYCSVVRLVHGHSERWIKIQQDIGKDPGLIRTMLFMTTIGLSHGINHIRLAFQSIKLRKNTV
ncbi:MAG: UDP-forming cellulose synthase catalytic subunit [Methylomonas sp.]